MRDLVVQEALKTMADDAASRLRELIAGGEQIPYEVEEPDTGSPLPRYIPLTERFIAHHAPALRELDSFGSGCAAIEAAGLARPYLEALGVAVPGEDRKRGELAGVAFLCRLWQESTDFTLDADRMAAAITELEAGGEAADDEIEVVVPLRGLQLPTTRLELATATIVRSDTVEVPAEARAAEGAGAAGWEPIFLAATRVSAREVADDQGEAPVDAGARAVAAFRQLITTLRLFKAGGVSLGPYAWTRAGTNRWRRIATGAGRSRPGGYRLAEQELGDLAAVSRTLAYRSSPHARAAVDGRGSARAFGRAISRFEAGLERGVALEALNDHLLALRFLLEGGGPAELSLSMRVAALCAEPEDRGEIKAIVDRALAMERELWSGEPAGAAQQADKASTPAQTTAMIEELIRAILRDAACGHLGSDLRSTADEILLADGLAVGEGAADQRGGDEEWDGSLEPELPVDRDQPDEAQPITAAGELSEVELRIFEQAPDAPGEAARERCLQGADALDESRDALDESRMDASAERAEPSAAGERLPGMQVPEPGGRISGKSHPLPEEHNLLNAQTELEPSTTTMEAVQPHGRLAELLEERPREQRQTADRVAYLFPRPDTTEWDVRELSYDRRRRARVRAS